MHNPLITKCLYRGISVARDVFPGVLLMAALTVAAIGQTAPLDAGAMVMTPVVERNELQVQFRLVEDTVSPSPGVQANATGADALITTSWRPLGADIPATAWLIIIDNSDPRRAATIAENARVVSEFIGKLPQRDAFTVHTLARELVLVAPFGTTSEEAISRVANVRPGGTEALVTLIHQSVREGLRLLDERDEPRKAVLLLTDGIDETAGGPDAIEAERQRLIEAANERGVAIHTICYAERASLMTYFGPFREISADTGGIHIPAEPADRGATSRQIPPGSLDRIVRAMQGTGTVVLNLAALKEIEPVPEVVVEVMTESGRPARINIPSEQVAAALAGPQPDDLSVDEPAEDASPVDEPPADEPAEEDLATDDPPEEDHPEVIEETTSIPFLLWVLLGLFILFGVIAIIKIRANNQRREAEALAAEEAARVAAAREEEARIAEETRIAEDARRAAEQANKAEDKPLAWLEMCDAQQTRHPIRIPNLKVGRGQHNDFVLRNDSVSGNHCVINRTRDGEWTVTDLNSGNGVILNGNQVQQASLRHGDTIELGDLKMRFLLHP